MYDEIKGLLLDAIRYPRPERVDKVCLPVWNQSFFYKIDKARVLTISYNPTDKGARENYPEQVARYIKNGNLDAEEIFDLLYDFKKEKYWRKSYDLLFDTLGIADENIAHMDVSFFPYRTLNDYLSNKDIDDTYKFLLKAIELLSDNLQYILIDGAKNKNIVDLFIKDYMLIDRALLPINSGAPHKLYIYKHKTLPTILIYYECFLYGFTCPKEYYVKKLAEYIKNTVDNTGRKKTDMKLCPKCELNYIADTEELCSLCKTPSKNSGSSQVHRARTTKLFDEDFTFSNEAAAYRGKNGYVAYDSQGNKVGIVYMTDDKRSPSYGYCELCIYPAYQSRYGEWRRFTSYGCRLKWDVLCERLKNEPKYICHID